MLLFSISISEWDRLEPPPPLPAADWRFLENALVVVVHRHGQRLLGMLLTDAGKVKLAP